MISTKFTLGLSIACLVLFYSPVNTHAQAPAIEWQKSYGGSSADGANSMKQTADGGFILGGYSCSINKDVTGNHGDYDCWVVKTNDTGGMMWQKSLGGSGYDQVDQIKPDINGGYIIAAYTESNNGQVSGNHGGGDAWALKLDDTGGIVWQKAMGSSGLDFFNSVINTPDSGYLFIGGAGANGGDVSGFSGGGQDLWVVKMNKSGTVSWAKTLGGPGYEIGFDAIATVGGGFMISAEATANGGMVSGFHGGNYDAWVVKIDDTGKVIWSKTYGGTAEDRSFSINHRSDNTYIVAGYSNSVNGDVPATGHGGFDYWVFNIDDTGKVLWKNSYGGFGNDILNQADVTYDDGAILGGYSISTDGQVSGNHGGNDYWMVRIDKMGNPAWANTFGGSMGDTIYSIVATSDSGYAAVGASNSVNGDITNPQGNEDIWLVKLKNDRSVSVSTIDANKAISVYPTLTSGEISIDLPAGYDKAELYLTNIAGSRQVINSVVVNGNQRKISCVSLQPGMYFLQVVNGNEVNTFRVIYQP